MNPVLCTYNNCSRIKGVDHNPGTVLLEASATKPVIRHSKEVSVSPAWTVAIVDIPAKFTYLVAYAAV
jgi:hypothetical protein